MGCYTVPLLAAFIHYGLRRRNGWNGRHDRLLNVLFVGGAVFGVVDHSWNRELLVFSLPDVLLGVVITACIVLLAVVVLVFDRRSSFAATVGPRKG